MSKRGHEQFLADHDDGALGTDGGRSELGLISNTRVKIESPPERDMATNATLDFAESTQLESSGRSVIAVANPDTPTSISRRPSPFAKHLDTGKYTDFKFVCKDGKEVRAHKMVLDEESEFFEKFQGDCITLDKHDSDTVSRMLAFVYKAKLEEAGNALPGSMSLVCNQKNLLHLVKLWGVAAEFGINDLNQITLDRIRHHLHKGGQRSDTLASSIEFVYEVYGIGNPVAELFQEAVSEGCLQDFLKSAPFENFAKEKGGVMYPLMNAQVRWLEGLVASKEQGHGKKLNELEATKTRILALEEENARMRDSLEAEARRRTEVEMNLQTREAEVSQLKVEKVYLERTHNLSQRIQSQQRLLLEFRRNLLGEYKFIFSTLQHEVRGRRTSSRCHKCKKQLLFNVDTGAKHVFLACKDWKNETYEKDMR